MMELCSGAFEKQQSQFDTDHDENHSLLIDNTSQIDDDCGPETERSNCCCSYKHQIHFYLIILLSSLGSFLFGYNASVVSGAMLKVNIYFNLSQIWHELIVTILTVAVGIGSLIASILSDKFGRKPVISIAALIIVIGAFVSATAFNKYALLCGRMISGIGCGFIISVVPIYIAELSPARVRGKLIMGSFVIFNGGQLIGVLVAGVFSKLDLEIGWRLMFGVIAVPATGVFVGFMFSVESPRWLVFNGKDDEALKVLMKLRKSSKVEKELNRIQNDYKESRKAKLGCKGLVIKFVTSRSVLLALMVGCGLQVIQQLTGVNAIIYYGGSVMTMVGHDDNTAIWFASIFTAFNMAFTIVGAILVDHIGRRTLTIISLIGVIISLVIVSGSFVITNVYSVPAQSQHGAEQCQYNTCGSCVSNTHCGFCALHDIHNAEYVNGTCVLIKGSSHSFDYNDTAKICAEYTAVTDGSLLDSRKVFFTYNACPNVKYGFLSFAGIIVFIAFFAPGLGALTWTINSEIYPTWARSISYSIATVTYSITIAVLSFAFLTLSDALGHPGIFGLFASFSLLGLIFVIFFLPETKGRTLEDIEQLFRTPLIVQWWNDKRTIK